MLRVAARNRILCRTGLLLWKAGDMKEIVIASPVTQQLSDFSEALGQTSGLKMTHCRSVAETLTSIAKPTVLMLIVDTRLGAEEAKRLIRDTLMVNAMIHSAVLGNASEENFHDYMEGLGVLMQLSLTPTKADAQVLWQRLRAING